MFERVMESFTHKLGIKLINISRRCTQLLSVHMSPKEATLEKDSSQQALTFPKPAFLLRKVASSQKLCRIIHEEPALGWNYHNHN
jgi:hypothetical protein